MLTAQFSKRLFIVMGLACSDDEPTRGLACSDDETTRPELAAGAEEPPAKQKT